MSDAVPLFGMHRKPYLVMGMLLYSTSYLWYGLSGIDDYRFLCLCVFLATIGLIQMDVMADTMVVERSQFEPDGQKGQMQATCYSMRFAGSVVGALLAIALTSHIHSKNHGLLEVLEGRAGMEFHSVCIVIGLLPLVLMLPFMYFLVERYRNVAGMGAQGVDKNVRTYYGATTDGSERLGVDREYAYESPRPGRDRRVQRVDKGNGDEEAPLIPLSPHRYNRRAVGLSHEAMAAEVGPLSISKQLDQIWMTVQRTVVFGPLSFVYVYNIMQVPNVAWQSYLQLALHFPASVLGITVTVGSFMTFIGILVYKKYFFGASWRSIYIWSTLLTCFFSVTQVMLIFQINTRYLGINNYFFSVGDDVIQQFISGVQFLPVCILYMRLCPEGSEGASYSMLTTFGNIALVCANNVGSWLSGLWDVSNDAMRENDFYGLWRLTVLTSVLSVLPLALLGLLPRDTAEQEALGEKQDRSKLGGGLFLVVLFTSILASLVSAFSTVMSSSHHDGTASVPL